MNLPYDYARCEGATVEIPNERGGFPCTAFRRGCADCLRRTSPGPPEHQLHMEPPKFQGGRCPQRIDPREWPEAAA